jgi:ubiquinone/menaquinone biosynthesis C-methylase UbiE
MTVQTQFGRAAAAYTESGVHRDPAALEKVVALAQPAATDSALDIATGAGHVALALAPHVARVVAYDLTDHMLRETARNAAARGLANIVVQQGAAEQLPFAHAVFDIITVRHAPHHFADVRRAAAEMARVAKSGARLVVVDSYSPESPELAAQWHRIETLRDASHVRNYTPGEWREVLRSAAWRIVFEELDYCTENGRRMNFAAWTRRIQTPPSAVAELERLFRTAPPELAELLRIEIAEGEIGFCVPQITIAAIR